MHATRSITGCDPWQMALIHRLIRRGFEQARSYAVTSTSSGAERVDAVAEYVQFHLDGLHAHHTTEDELLWPKLRVRAQLAETLVDRMEAQHAAIHGAIEEVDTALVCWRQSPDTRSLSALTDALDTLLHRLHEHLGEEERDIVPLIAASVTSEEWDELGRTAFAKFSPQQRFTAMGEMLATATTEEAARMMADLPLPIRVVWRVFGARRYERAMAALAR